MLPLSRDMARCIALANHEAKRLGSARLEPAHLLLGLCAADPSLAPSLHALPLNVPIRLLRLHAEKLMGCRRADVVRDIVPPSPTARRVLMDAAAEARRRGQMEVAQEHLLASLLYDDGGIAAYLLEHVQVDPIAVRATLTAALDHGCPAPAPIPSLPTGGPVGVLVYAEPAKRSRRDAVLAVTGHVVVALFALLSILSFGFTLVILSRL